MEPWLQTRRQTGTSRVAAGNQSGTCTTGRAGRACSTTSGSITQRDDVDSTRRVLHLGSATLLVNRERPTLVSGAACHRDIRCIRRHIGHTIQGNQERLDGSGRLLAAKPFGTVQPTVGTPWKPGDTVVSLGSGNHPYPKIRATAIRRYKARTVCAEEGQPLRRVESPNAPREMQLANWGNPATGLHSPRKSVPVALWVRQRSGRCSLGLPPPQGFLSRNREERFRVLNLHELRRTPDPKVVSETAPRGLTSPGLACLCSRLPPLSRFPTLSPEPAVLPEGNSTMRPLRVGGQLDALA